MRTFKTIFKIEYKNISIKRNLIILASFGVVLLLFVHFDMINYKSIIESKKSFEEISEERANYYVYYDQYGGHGIKIKFIPSPISIFNSNSILNESLSHINIGEKLNIHKPIKYSDLVIENSGYMGFTGINLIFAVIFGLIGGYELTKNRDFFKQLSKKKSRPKIFFLIALSKIILLSSAFLILFAICLIWLYINDINLFSYLTILIYFIVILIILTFFAGGAFLSSIIKDKSTKIGILAAFFIVSVILIPLIAKKGNQIIAKDIESLESFELVNLKLFMEAERKALKKYGIYKNKGDIAPEKALKIVEDALRGEFKKISDREQEKRNQILRKIKVSHTLMSIFPITFYFTFNKEISGCGEFGFIYFHSFSQKTKDDFITFIIKEKFYSKAIPGNVKPFTKKGEDNNIFYARSHLPFNFWLGIFLTVFYSVVLLFVSYRMQKKRFQIQKPIGVYNIENEKGNPLFVLCENEEIKSDIFNYYQSKKAVCLEKINTGDFMFKGIKALEIFKHLCQISGVNETKAFENLNHMGINNLNGLRVCHEVILKIYVAVTAVEDSDLIVLNDFLKNESREFEKDFINFLLLLEKSGKKILYLSTQIYQTKYLNNVDEKIHVDKFKSISINLNKITLR